MARAARRDEDDAPPPEPDRVPGAPHPRMAPSVIGQDHAVAEFEEAASGGRLHHAWLLTGPRGVGKATLAWAAARWLLSDRRGAGLNAPEADAGLLARLHALSEPRIELVRRPFDDKTGKLKTVIGVDEIRRLGSFFHLSAAGGGRRIALIDAADELNTAAANALLKLLEEPPKGALLFLIAHQPARLLPTIRSRCRTLRLGPLDPDAMAAVLDRAGAMGDPARLAALSGGSAGEALRLTGAGGLEAYQQITDLMATLPRMDRLAAARLADRAGARPAGGEGDPFDLVVTLLDRFLTRAARAGLMGPPLPEAADGEGALLARLAPDAEAARGWAAAQAQLSARARAGRAVNLDPGTLVMDMLVALARAPVAHGLQGPA